MFCPSRQTFAALLLLVTGAFPLLAAPRVEMELISEDANAMRSSPKWIALLPKLGCDGIRIRSLQPGDEIKIKKSGSDKDPRYTIVGQLSSSGQLILPGGRFRISDSGALRDYLSRIRSSASPASQGPKTAYGVSAEQLQDVRKVLSAPLNFSTKDVAIETIVKKIGEQVSLPLQVTAADTQAMRVAGTFPDELQNVSAGTALAAVGRPAGLALTLQSDANGQVLLQLGKPKPGESIWPIGWKPEQTERELMPVLFEFLPVEIDPTPLPKILAALQPRIKAPFLIDHNMLAKHRIDIAAKKVSFPSQRSYYKRILDRLLFQAMLKSEIRIDEAGNPILWITTIKQ